MTNNFDEHVVQYILVRKDLNMGYGKMASQVAHASNASFYPYLEDDDVKKWLNGIFTKIILSIDGLKEANKVIEILKNNNIIYSAIRDNCLTELQPEEDGRTLTCIGIKPYPKSLISHLVKRYQLYK